MKTKLLPLLAALLLLFGVLTSCTPKAPEPQPSQSARNSQQEPQTAAPESSRSSEVTTTPPSSVSIETPSQPQASSAPAKQDSAPRETSKPVPTAPEATQPKEPTPPSETVSEPPETTPEQAEEDTVKAADSRLVTLDPAKVMNIDTDKGLLSIRYFMLYSEKKSGDSILVRTPSGKNILIDAGVVESSEQLVGYLTMLGITRIDVLINTHPHSDHLGGMQSVITNFEVGDYYKNPREYTSSSYVNTIDALAAKSVPVHIVAEGDEINLGDGLSFHVYNPPRDMDPNQYSDPITQFNCESLVLMLTYNKTKILFSGDMYQPAEVDMLVRYPEGTFDADIVHAPHHGASTSSSTDYIIATTPQIAVMSTNSFQSQATYDTYVVYDAAVVANSVNGNLLITTDGETVHAYVEEQLEPGDVPKYATGD